MDAWELTDVEQWFRRMMRRTPNDELKAVVDLIEAQRVLTELRASDTTWAAVIQAPPGAAPLEVLRLALAVAAAKGVRPGRVGSKRNQAALAALAEGYYLRWPPLED